MKRLLALLLVVVTALCLLNGCAQKTPETTAAPTPTQTPEEESVLKILVLGNSHSNDAFWLLREVFKDQMPEQELVLGIMYYSGCPVDKHVKFYVEKQPVYEYHRNSNGTWETMKEVTLDVGLRHQAWDYVLLQPGRADSDDTLNLDGRRALEKIVEENVFKPYALGWHSTWPNPNDPTFFSPDYEVQPPAGLQQELQTQNGHDPFVQNSKRVELTVNNIVGDPTYEKQLDVGGGIMYAHAKLGVPQLELWRDYTHLSDYGRLIAAFSFYTQFTGEAITEINIDVIPASLRHRRFRDQGDLVITEEMKQVIIAAANNALEHPWEKYEN